MTGVPLLAGRGDAPFAYRHGAAIAASTFVADVLRTADALPASGHVLNVCADRYRFAVGFAAAIVRNQVSLLPSSTHAATIEALRREFPDLYALTEGPDGTLGLPQYVLEPAPARVVGDPTLPDIPSDRAIAYVFTSGSTGVPTRHVKRWGAVSASVRAAAARLFGATAAPTAIVATVPPQHMYGLESSLLLAWQARATLVAERPFFPADIVASLAACPGRRMLVTTPFHLKTLLADGLALPAVDQVLCATAPLSPELAREAESRFAAPVSEIYGCTETGQLATRRPMVDACWKLFDGVRLTIADGLATADGGHVEQPTPLSDLITLADDHAATGRFSLAGRTGDLVNIAGKRTSLGFLNHQLQSIEGVVDGAYFLPDDDAAHRDGVTRLGAVAVAPGLGVAEVLSRLRARIDAAFLPRPLHLVPELPRNATGKLTAAVLKGLVAATPPADPPRPGTR